MRLFANADYKFLEQRKTAYMVSAALVVIGLLSVVLHGGLNYGVDFTGGTLFQIQFAEDVTAADVRGALGEAGFDNLQVHDLWEGGTRVQTFLPELNELQKDLLELMEVPEEVYTRVV